MLIQHIAESRDGGLAGNGGTTVEEVSNLQELYRNSKKRFDDEPDFKTRARSSVRELQSGNPLYVKASHSGRLFRAKSQHLSGLFMPV